MFRNPFIHARTTSDWVIGLLIAASSGVLVSLFLVVFEG